MLQLGIDDNQGLIFEGTANYGRVVWPTPIITPAKFIFMSEEAPSAEKSSESPTTSCRFREDYYDPIARIRRGRFYFAEGAQPVEWRVLPHPALPIDPYTGQVGVQKTSLFTFYGNPIWHKYFEGKSELPVVALGVDDRFSLWSVVGVEGMYTREDLVTLKALSSLGVLPVVDYGQVPQGQHAVLRETLDAFVDEVHRAAPVSVIDRARETVTQILLCSSEATKENAQDLAKLTEQLERKSMIIAASAAKIIARLHARGKPAEQLKRDLPSIRAKDAELAVHCVGTILCELGLAKWP